MQLLGSPASPFVRKVRVVILETDQTAEIEEVDVSTTPVNSATEVIAANPTGKIPALIRPDRPAIYDSRVICQFLNDRAKADLYPDARKWDTLTLEATADAIMEAAVLMVYEKRVRPENEQSPAWIEAQWGKVQRALDAVNTRWMSHLAGPMDAAHIAMGCALGYLDFRHEGRGWRSGVDGLADWYEAFSVRDSMQKTAPTA
ncbi:glutathione S-transferase [Nereida sp. MMG025]|uniref:glutathione S-transferase n=1 Tax=Nereida sp. MMG025 TaxID=2909981 RepID=UPI001F288EE7|nr:glutathione S-transferase [Nereida sp. MMG025]MCF6444508.1 glutathione S-transferase [Nereida sp. MMG025]